LITANPRASETEKWLGEFRIPFDKSSLLQQSEQAGRAISCVARLSHQIGHLLAQAFGSRLLTPFKAEP